MKIYNEIVFDIDGNVTYEDSFEYSGDVHLLRVQTDPPVEPLFKPFEFNLNLDWNLPFDIPTPWPSPRPTVEEDTSESMRAFSVFQSSLSSTTAGATTKRVLDWSAFFVESNVPVIGYDAISNTLVILKGSDHSADSSKDILVFDFTTGTWTKGDTKFSASLDISDMITTPDTGELVALHINSSAAANLKRFKAHQSANISSQTVNMTTPFFDFGSSGNAKRLYKVKVLCQGANLDDLAIVASYDGNTGSYSNIFSSNTFSNTTADDWGTQTFTVSSITDFNNISIKIYSTGAMTTADWGISEISFIYREKGYR